jgi:hypothetical protein
MTLAHISRMEAFRTGFPAETALSNLRSARRSMVLRESVSSGYRSRSHLLNTTYQTVEKRSRRLTWCHPIVLVQ